MRAEKLPHAANKMAFYAIVLDPARVDLAGIAARPVGSFRA
jgi:hypothetical protein